MLNATRNTMLPVVGVFYSIYFTMKCSIKQADYFVIYDLLSNVKK
jgi:hypothetical protein